MRKINLNHLYYFYITAKEGSVKAAAERLHVSQPTISDQIRLLEDFFENKLFERVARSLVLNSNGRLALDYAEKIFGLASELTNQLFDESGAIKKQIDIGITDYMSQYFLYDLLLPLFQNKNTMISFKEGKRAYLLADLERGEKDMILSYSKDSIPLSIESFRIGLNKTYIVAHKKFVQYQNSFPDCLNDIPYLGYTHNSFLRYEIDLYFAKYKISPKSLGECDDMELFDIICREGLGFVIVPEVAKIRMTKDPSIIVLGELTELETSVWAMMRKDNRGLLKDFIKRIEI